MLEDEIVRPSQDAVCASLAELLGSSQSMQQVFALAQRVAPSDVTVLISGETGTWKELLARAIHRMSSQTEKAFVACSCANLPETLIESRLFGHEPNAFAGTSPSRRGLMELADRGTLFLDEVGALSASLQDKLLRALQEHRFESLGGSDATSVNTRLVCATTRILEEMIGQGEFREDLYYWLNVVEIHIPPLRERREDIPFIAENSLRRFAEQHSKTARRFSRPALHALEEYHWPGNMRELENVVQRAAALADGSTIESWNLPGQLSQGFKEPASALSYEQEVREFKRRLLLRTLREFQWQKSETARNLQMARTYLHRLINDLEIEPEEETRQIRRQSLPTISSDTAMTSNI